MAEVILATWEHIDPIATHMRAADVTEVWLAAHKTPHQAMQDGFNMSVKAWTIMQDGVPIGMFGVSSVSVLGNTGIPWLLGTDAMLKIRRQFIRESMRYLDEVMALYPRLVNFIHAGNVQSLRWLMWMGFDFEGPVKAGPDGAEFFKFERLSDV